MKLQFKDRDFFVDPTPNGGSQVITTVAMRIRESVGENYVLVPEDRTFTIQYAVVFDDPFRVDRALGEKLLRRFLVFCRTVQGMHREHREFRSRVDTTGARVVIQLAGTGSDGSRVHFAARLPKVRFEFENSGRVGVIQELDYDKFLAAGLTQLLHRLDD